MGFSLRSGYRKKVCRSRVGAICSASEDWSENPLGVCRSFMKPDGVSGSLGDGASTAEGPALGRSAGLALSGEGLAGTRPPELRARSLGCIPCRGRARLRKLLGMPQQLGGAR
jgi:hypothetical protein